MKNERRHELQQNELADQLVKARTWIEPYVVPILVAVILVALISGGYNFFKSRAVSQRSEATFDLLFSTIAEPGGSEDAEAYNAVTTKFPETAAAEIAALSKADVYLANGVDAMFTDREEAKGLLDDAEKAYLQVTTESTSTLMKSRAFYGLAQTLESKGDVEGAKEAFQTVIDLNESEAMSKAAARRLKSLDSADIQAFVSWFAQQQPSAFDPAASPGMPSGTGLPGSPDMQFPGVAPPATGDGEVVPGLTDALNNALGGTTSSEPLPENPDIEVPAEGTPVEPPAANDSLIEVPAEPTEPAMDSPASETPATEPPATEPPATEPAATEPPATEPPATEPPATEPPTTEPPATESPATEPPATEPPATEPPATEPPATEPPATEPPATEPPATEPPATEPPATEPPATEPPATEPPATEPPATEPPATEPPATEPPATEPPATEPPATEPAPVEEPPAAETPATEPPPAEEPPADEPPAGDEPPALSQSDRS
ncbi:hypothetical protein SH139x_000398 [Planctomycetaceae bacterium SH139]